jgi:hypothetical protein
MAAAFATMDQVPISHGEEVGNLKGKKSKQGPRKRVSQACNKYVLWKATKCPLYVLLAH